MTDCTTSSATKLYQILINAYNLDGNSNTTQVWSQSLLFNPDVDRSIENKYIELLSLFKYVKNDLNILSQDGVDTDKYLRAIDHVLLALFSSPINSQWQQIKSRIQLTSLDVLASCGDLMISKGKGFKEASEQELNEVLTLIEDIRVQINNSDLEDTTKKALIDKIQRLKNSLKMYHVFGANEFKKVTEEVLMETIILSKEVGIETLSKENKNNFNSFFDLLLKCNSLYTSAEKIYPQLKHLIHYASQHLLPGR